MNRADNRINTWLEQIQQLHVVVIGDIMLDKYIIGDIDRISPEAPVPVFVTKEHRNRLGGAANVALNCVALGAQCTLAGIVGHDTDAEILKELCRSNGIDTALVMTGSRPTTTKTRVISRNQQVLRIDEELAQDLDTQEEHPFIDKVLRFIQIRKPDIVILEDYNKGVLKENVIHKILEHCKELGALTAVDPKRKNFLAYKGVNLFKPNLKELREGLNIPLQNCNIEELNRAHDLLHEHLDHQVSFVTLSEKGVYVNDGKEGKLFPTRAKSIADVSGAGDTVIAIASIIYKITGAPELMAVLANLAGGLVCEEVGVVPVNKDKWSSEAGKLLKELAI